MRKLQAGRDGIDLSRQRRARGIYCKHCEQILDILRNRDRKPSPSLFDKSVLDLYIDLMEHTVADSRVQEMRRICIELLEVEISRQVTGTW